MKDFSLPKQFDDQMRSKLADSFADFKNSLAHPSPVSIRINPSKYTKTISRERIPWSDYGWYLPERPIFTLDPWFHAGAYYVQEASSMFLEQVFTQCIPSDQPIAILDLSAAPGGKSTHILSLIHPDSVLVSNEVIRSRANILAENIQKWGHANAIVTNNDPKDFEHLPGFFDVIVVDAPCSGEGLFRKDPEAIKEWSPENVALCSARQKRIIADVWPALKEGGVMIYSTCTYNPAENEENLKWVKQNHEIEFLRVDIENFSGIIEEQSDGAMGYRFFPHLIKGEGFFISAFRKTEPQTEARVGRFKKNAVPSNKVSSVISTWLKDPERVHLIQRGDVVSLFPMPNVEKMEFFADKLRVVTAGTIAASVKHDKVVPEHAMALSIAINPEAIDCVEVTEAQAIDYMRKQTPDFDSTNKKGMKLVTHKGLPLGWINVLDRRINNLYPTAWRIRMQN